MPPAGDAKNLGAKELSGEGERNWEELAGEEKRRKSSTHGLSKYPSEFGPRTPKKDKLLPDIKIFVAGCRLWGL